MALGGKVIRHMHGELGVPLRLLSTPSLATLLEGFITFVTYTLSSICYISLYLFFFGYLIKNVPIFYKTSAFISVIIYSPPLNWVSRNAVDSRLF
jgi:hypothetical protein